MPSFYMYDSTDRMIYCSASLSNPFNTNYYQSLVLSTGTTSEGSTSQPSGVHYALDAYNPSSFTQSTVYFTKTGLSSSTTYYWYCYTKALNGRWYQVGYDYYTTKEPPKPRPSNFYWYTAKNSGGSFDVSAYEWNSLCSRINEFRRYKGYTDYYFSYVFSGDQFMAYQFNEARNAINSLNPPTSVPSSANSNSIIYATDLNRLVNALNSIS